MTRLEESPLCCQVCTDKDTVQGTYCTRIPYCARLAEYGQPLPEEETHETTDNDMKENTTSTNEGKRCPRCGRVLPWDNFALKSNAKDGHQAYCRECTAAMNKQLREERLARIKAAEQARTQEKAAAQAEGPAAVEEPAPLPLIDVFADKELVAELRRRGYDVTARKVMTVEL